MDTRQNEPSRTAHNFRYPLITTDPENARYFTVFLLGQVPMELRTALVRFLVQAVEVSNAGDPTKMMQLDEDELAARDHWDRAFETHFPNYLQICEDLKARTRLESFRGPVQ